ncbi:MAG: DoxX family protein [Gemmatimonadaceae bacterium]|nr:DoxX family protein [Gemmatimonadaceae bacterium]
MTGWRSLLLLDALPTRSDLALLLLRVWLGLSMVTLHGWGKLDRLLDGDTKFRSVFGLPESVSLGLAAGAEVFGALLVVVGLATRWSALWVAATMAMAFILGHGGALKGPGNGEMPFIFLAGFLAIFLAGPGKYSVDAKLAAK